MQNNPDLAPELQQAHRHIALAAIRTNDGLWENLDSDSISELYDLRFVADHCQRAGIASEEVLFSLNQVYGGGCWRTGAIANRQNRHQIATELFDQAIYVFTQLYDQGRTEIENDLASALMNKGVALSGLTRYAEAIEAQDQAIEIYQRLVDEGRTEIENDLAMALMNKGNVLDSLTRSAEAIEAYDRAIAIRQRLVVDEGRTEIENDLAMALMNKGVALYILTRYAEAIEAYDRAIAIRQRLVDQGRTEIENGLVMALINKANTQTVQGHFEQALLTYAAGLGIWIQMFQSGKVFILPNLIKGFRIRFDLCIRLERWQDAANDLGFLAICTYQAIAHGFAMQVISPSLVTVAKGFMQLPEEQREGLYLLLDEGTRSFMDQLLALLEDN